MLRRFSINFALFSMVLDGILVDLFLWLTAFIRPAFNSFPYILPIVGKIILPVYLYILFPLIWVLIFATLSIYDGKKYLHVSSEFAALSWASLIAGISMAGVLYLSFRDLSRFEYIFFIVLTYLSFLLWRGLARLIFRLSRNHIETARRIIIIGAGRNGQMVEQRLKDYPGVTQEILGYIDENRPEAFDGNLLGHIHELDKIVQDLHVTDAVIALPIHFHEQIRGAVDQLSKLPVRVWLLPGSFTFAVYKPTINELGDLPLLDLRASALGEYDRMVKRGFDLLIGSLLLLFCAPIIGFAALVIWSEDHGPVFFRQKRVGENGKIFEMIKLRTMIRNADEMRGNFLKLDADGNVVHKFKGDPRVTGTGRVLRRFSIDELPQLFNVIKGDMSLVGPRPELPVLVEQYQPWQRQRFVVPPGMTGWWQVNGRSDRPMHLHTEDDLYYIQNCSIWLDMQILIRTLWTVMIGKGSY